jgi:hypothetical protein
MPESSNNEPCDRAWPRLEGRAGAAEMPAYMRVEGVIEDEVMGSEEREIEIWTLGAAFRMAGNCYVDRVFRSSLSNQAMRRSPRTGGGGFGPRNRATNRA